MAEWTDKRTERLKELHGHGWSASQIARDLGGVSRSAVIGKIDRLGLGSRVARADRPKPIPNVPRLKPAKLYHNPPYTPDPAPLEIDGKRITVLTITDRMCKYGHGDPTDAKFHFCGQAPKPGSRYCEFHHARCYVPNIHRRVG